jgi:hypothetical protein
MHTYVKNAVYNVAKDLSRYRRKMVTMEPAIAQYVNPEVESNKNDKSIDGVTDIRLLALYIGMLTRLINIITPLVRP